MLNFIKNISSPELIVIVLILVMIFGRKTVIALGRTSGEVLKELKNIKKGITGSFEDKEVDKK
jgi:Sec-independent protein translocase protein TatA